MPFIASRRALHDAADDPTFVLRDDFDSDVAAGSVDGTSAEPGPGTREVNDTSDQLSLSGGCVQTDGRDGAADPGLGLESVAVQAGRAFLFKMVIPSSGNFHAAWHNAAWGYLTHGLKWQSGSVKVYVGTQYGTLGASSGEEIWGAVVWRESTGVWIVVKNPSTGNWRMGYAAENKNYANAKPRFGAFASAPSGTESVLASMRVADLATPWTTDATIATQILSGSRNAGDTFTHEANAEIAFDVDTLPTSGQIEVRFRVQDSSNYWQVTINASGDLELDEVVSGSPTQRASDAGVIANGDRIRITARDASIALYEGGSDNLSASCSYGSASNFQTETAGEIETLGTGGAVSDLKAWPYVLPTDAARELDKYIT